MIVFAGPTLSPQDAPDFEFRPPAAQGDLYCAARERPAAIGLIDGYFDERPAVLHKEILWALAEGIPVYGAASMGALRAAELHVFGMRGIGRIFEDYRDGRVTADDAVAVEHGPHETGYVSLSEPLVNIEATMARAVREGIAGADEADAVCAQAKALHYRDRTWRGLLDDPSHAHLKHWVLANRVDQKRIDALQMLAAMRVATPAPAPNFRFQHTDLWQDVVDRSQVRHAAAAGEREYLLDEVRLAPDLADLRWQAMARRLVRRPASAPAADAAAVADLRMRLGLYRKEVLDHWLAANGLDEQDFSRLAAETLTLSRSLDSHWAEALVDELRLAGRLDPILARMKRKRTALAALGREEEASGDRPRAETSLAALIAWYCNGHDMPPPADIGAFGRMLGFEDRAALQRALSRERTYCQWQAEQPHETGPAGKSAGHG